MKKQTQRNHGGLIALFSVLAFTVLGLGACMNPVQAPERSPDGSTGVRISIAAGEERTLLPEATFSKYKLHFSTDEVGVTVPADQTLTETNAVIPLEPADWTITVTAYVTVKEGGDVAAAEGKAQVSLSAGELKGVSIRVSSKLDGAAGYFSYDVEYPEDVTGGYLEIYDGSGNNVVLYRDLFSQPAEDGISLAPGYYRLRVGLQTAYSMAARTEIVHIYPGMETRGDYVFTEADFGVPIEISGTVDLSGLGTVSSVGIGLYRDSDFTYQEGSIYEYDPSGGSWSWTIRMLPFNQPANLYVLLRVVSNNGILTKRLPVPISVYNQNVAAPALGPFTANWFSLSGEVDLSVLTAGGVTISYIQVNIHEDGDVPQHLGGFFRESSSGLSSWTWSYDILTEEASLPVWITLRAQTSGGIIYDSIQETLTASRSDLDFIPGPVSAGTQINGRGVGSEYAYVFVPETSGVYAFTLSPAGSHSSWLYLYDASGNLLDSVYGYPEATLSRSLTAGDAYYIRLELNSPYRTFQFQVNPLTQAALGGTVDFSGILSPFGSGVTVSGADIKIYSDNSFHTMLGTSAIDTGDGSWSATVDYAGASAPVVFVIAATLSNGQTIHHDGYGSISGDNNDLDFSPAAVTGLSPVTRTTVSQYDRLLYVPATTGTYSLGITAGENSYMGLQLYDAQTGNQLYSAYGYGELEIVRTLTAEYPYIIQVYSANSFATTTYQFQAEELQPAVLSGTVSFAGLAPLTGADIGTIYITVYTGASSPVQLGWTTAGSDGSWSMQVPASESQTVNIAANVYLNNGHSIIAHRQDTITGDTENLDLALAAVSPLSGQPVPRISSYNQDQFLLVPSDDGFFNLEAISSAGYAPGLTLYDAAGAMLARNDRGSLYAALSAGAPYIVEVYELGNFTAYQFLMTATEPASIGGSVDYSGLPESIKSAIGSATVSGYLNNSANTQILSAGAPAADGLWSALVPANAIGQTVRLALTLNLNNGFPITTSHSQTVLAADASDIDFAPAAVTSGAVTDGRSGADGSDWLLLVPASGGMFTLQAASDTYISIEVYNGLTGSWIASSPYSYPTVTLSAELDSETPYIIRIYLNGYSFRDYQFYVDAVSP